MKDQQWDLNETCPEVVSIYKCPQKFSGPSPKFGAQNITLLTTFCNFRISPERNVASTNNTGVNLQRVF